MLDSSLIPSRLVSRSPIQIASPEPPSRFRSLQILYDLGRTLLGIVWLWSRRRLTSRESGRQVREHLERMGTLWIRAGQIAALRSDMFSMEFCEELDKIRDQRPGFPFAMAKQIVEEELNAPLDRYFDEFKEHPFAASTVAQLHLAHLRRENVWVAVNIQRPYARATFAQDFRLIRRIAGFLRMFPRWKNMRWADFCHELGQILHKELDFRYEASLTRQMKETLAAQGIYLYSVYRDYSSQKVLVTEFIRGALMSDFVTLSQEDSLRLQRWLEQNNIQPKKLAKRLFACVFRQLFEDNFFHGDIRAYNMVLLRNSEFSVLDTRSVSSTETESLEKLRLFLTSLANEEFEIAADLFFLTTSVLPRVDTVEVRKHMIRMWKTWTLRTHIRELPYNEKSLTYMLAELNKIVRRYNFAVQWKTLYMLRTLANMDAIIQYLAPEANCIKWMKRYFDDAKRRESQSSLRDSQVTALRLLTKARDMPQRLAGYALFQDIVLRRQTQVISGTTAKAGYVLGALSAIAAFAFLLAEIFLVCAYLDQLHHERVEKSTVIASFGAQQSTAEKSRGEVLLGPQLTRLARKIPILPNWAWIAALLTVLFLFLFNRRMVKRFRAKEVRIPKSNVSV